MSSLKAGQEHHPAGTQESLSVFRSLARSHRSAGVGGAASPLEQVSRQYGVNPGFLNQWVEEMRRVEGRADIPCSTAAVRLCAERDARRATRWPVGPRRRRTIPRIRAQDSREDLAARYQELFDEADRKAWESWRRNESPHRTAKQKRWSATPSNRRKVCRIPPGSLPRTLVCQGRARSRAPGDAKQYYPQRRKINSRSWKRSARLWKRRRRIFPAPWECRKATRSRTCQINISRQPLDAGRRSAATFPARHRGRQSDTRFPPTRAAGCSWPNG